MSISSVLPFLASGTTVPASTAPTTAPVENGSLTLWVCIAWAVVALLVTYILGTFRRRSIVGPNRLGPDTSGWDLMLVLFTSFLAASFSAILAARAFARTPEGARIIVQNFAFNAGSCFAIVVMLTGLRPRQLTLLGTNPRWIPAGIAGGAATLFVLYPFISLISAAVVAAFARLQLNPPETHELLQLMSATQSRGLKLAAIGLAVVAAPLAEELTYRALLQTALGRAFVALQILLRHPPEVDVAQADSPDGSVIVNYRSAPPSLASTIPPPGAWQRWAAVIVTAAVFAAVHMNIAFFLPLFFLALGLGYIYERTGNLWITVAAHSLFNGAQIMYYLSSMR